MTALPLPSLSDGVVLLRGWTPADVAQQFAAFLDPGFLRHSDWAPDTEEALRQAMEDQHAARTRGVKLDLAVVDPASPGAVWGGVSLNSVEREQARAAVGYWLVPTARGRGAASRAVRLLAAWAFETLGLARLELTCGPENPASQRVAERAGFTREGLLRSHMAFQGGRRDTVVYGLLPGELR